jgi:hypothetical protein
LTTNRFFLQEGTTSLSGIEREHGQCLVLTSASETSSCAIRSSNRFALAPFKQNMTCLRSFTSGQHVIPHLSFFNTKLKLHIVVFQALLGSVDLWEVNCCRIIG